MVEDRGIAHDKIRLTTLSTQQQERLGTISEASTVYSQFINTSDTVISVGPNAHIDRDPSLLFATYQLREGGKVYVADPQYESATALTLDQMEEIAGTGIIGAGSVKTHFEELESIRSLGVPLAKPEWLGANSTAQNLRNLDGSSLQEGTIDTIIDRGTSPFIASQWENVDQQRDELSRIYSEYIRVLRVGGRVLHQTDQSNSGAYQIDYRKLLIEAGFEVEEIQVVDSFKIPVPQGTKSQLSASKNERVKHLNLLVEDSPSGSILNLGSTRPSRLLVATKQPISK